MRQAIRVYAIVALVAMGALLVGLLTHPASFFGEHGWIEWTLGMVLGFQLWVLVVIPLGVLAASDAARASRRGWLALFIALLVLAPIAAWIMPLSASVEILLFASPCPSSGGCPGLSVGIPTFVTQAGWAVAFLPIPIAALIYSLTSARSAAVRATAEADQGERRALSVWAIAGIVVMGALGYLATTGILYWQFGQGSPLRVEKIMESERMLSTVWIALAALPVAVASGALAHAARTGRWAWLASWIALAALALLSVSPEIWLGMLNPMMDAYILNNPWIGFLAPEPTGGGITIAPFIPPQQLMVSVVAPVVIMLVALLYARFVMEPGERAVAPAVA